MSEQGPLENFTENREKLKDFIDRHVKRDISDEYRDQLMGIADEGVRLEVEINRLRMVKAQVEAELGGVQDLKELHDSVAMFIRSGAYEVERSQGLWHDKSLAQVVMRYLGRERESAHTIFMHRIGRGVW